MSNSSNHNFNGVVKALRLVLIVFIFFFSIALLSNGLLLLSQDTITEFIKLSVNPFVALMIGMLSTALIQSSSATTTIIISFVAANTIGIPSAIAMIMGANIGTSVTSTIVALGMITKKGKYKRAIQVATMHDIFNIILCMILFPLEYYFGVISNIVAYFASILGGEPLAFTSGFGFSISKLSKSLTPLMGENPYIVILIAITLLVISLSFFTSTLKKRIVEKEDRFEEKILASPFRSFIWGFGLTALLQSSSFTTSIMVPIAAYSKIKPAKFFPFIMGANLGTTVTAIIVGVLMFPAALPIAFIHFLFNLLGIFILFPFKALRKIPLYLSCKLSDLAYKNVLYGIAYILILFFVIPFTLIFLAK